MARTSLTVRGRSLGACSLILTPQNPNATDTNHDNLQRATVRYVHLDFLLIQSQQEPFVLLFLSIHAAVVRECLSITVSSSSVTYFDILCSWLILWISPWSANFFLSCTIVHLFNILQRGTGTLISLQCWRLFCKLTNHNPLDVFYISFQYLQIPRTLVSNAEEVRAK